MVLLKSNRRQQMYLVGARALALAPIFMAPGLIAFASIDQTQAGVLRLEAYFGIP